MTTSVVAGTWVRDPLVGDSHGRDELLGFLEQAAALGWFHPDIAVWNAIVTEGSSSTPVGP